MLETTQRWTVKLICAGFVFCRYCISLLQIHNCGQLKYTVIFLNSHEAVLLFTDNAINVLPLCKALIGIFAWLNDWINCRCVKMERKNRKFYVTRIYNIMLCFVTSQQFNLLKVHSDNEFVAITVFVLDVQCILNKLHCLVVTFDLINNCCYGFHHCPLLRICNMMNK